MTFKGQGCRCLAESIITIIRMHLGHTGVKKFACLLVLWIQCAFSQLSQAVPVYYASHGG